MAELEPKSENFETLPCKGSSPNVIFDENIFVFKSKSVTKKGIVKYYECATAKKTKCPSRGKILGSTFEYVNVKNKHNHVASGEIINLKKLKASLLERAASELGKNLRDIFDEESTKNSYV
jgi:FLYWCH zinc finger domain